MSDSLEAMDPNLKEVLLDIAKDERSTLFRVEPRDIAVGVMDDVPSLSAGTAGWTPAERHLLQAYQEEVALLLRNAVRARVADDPVGKLWFVSAAPTHRRQRQVASEVARDAGELAGGLYVELMPVQVRSTLVDLSHTATQAQSSLEQLAYLAHRIAPSEVATILLSISHLLYDRTDEATRMLSNLVHSPMREEMKTYAWSNLGKAFSNKGESINAYDAHLRSRVGAASCLVSSWSCLATALDSEDARLIRDSIEFLGDICSGDDACLLELTGWSMEMRNAGWDPTIGMRILVGLGRSLSPEGRKAADAVL